MKIKDYEIIRHGVEHSDYFQGCGTAFSKFEYCETGIGDTEQEAFEDALELMAQCHSFNDGELDRLKSEHGEEWDAHDTQYHSGLSEAQWEEMLECGNPPYWHVSIRYNIA